MSAERPESNSNAAPLPSVSVVLCTLGLRKSVTQSLDSLVSQNYPAELIVVLNGPPNEEFAQLISNYPVRLLNERKRGVCASRNCAVRQAKGDIVCFIEDDSIAHPNWIQNLVRGFEDPQVACIVGRVVPDGPSFQPSIDHYAFYGERACTPWSMRPEPGWLDSVMEGTIVGFGCNFAFRKSFLLGCSMFPEDLGAGTAIGAADEVHMFIQVLKHGFTIFHDPDAVVTHVFDADPILRKRRAIQINAAWPAYLLKIFVDEKAYRSVTIRKMFSSVFAFVLCRVNKRSPPATPNVPELLTRKDKLRAYLRAPALFLKSRRTR